MTQRSVDVTPPAIQNAFTALREDVTAPFRYVSLAPLNITTSRELDRFTFSTRGIEGLVNTDNHKGVFRGILNYENADLPMQFNPKSELVSGNLQPYLELLAESADHVPTLREVIKRWSRDTDFGSKHILLSEYEGKLYEGTQQSRGRTDLVLDNIRRGVDPASAIQIMVYDILTN